MSMPSQIGVEDRDRSLQPGIGEGEEEDRRLSRPPQQHAARDQHRDRQQRQQQVGPRATDQGYGDGDGQQSPAAAACRVPVRGGGRRSARAGSGKFIYAAAAIRSAAQRMPATAASRL